MNVSELVQARFRESAVLKQQAADLLAGPLEKIAGEMVSRLKNGKKIVTCGNGGSFCDALHFAEELVVRYYLNRPPIRALTLETNPGALTAASNDYSYEDSFSRSAEAYLDQGDVLVAISTSGNSPNILRAIEMARKKGAWVLGFSGRTGGKMASLCDEIVCVPSDDTPRIQEIHITVIHILCELIEKEMFGR